MKRGKCLYCDHLVFKQVFNNSATVCTKNPPLMIPLPMRGALADQVGIQLTSLSPGVDPMDEYGCWEGLGDTKERRIEREAILEHMKAPRSSANEGFQAADPTKKWKRDPDDERREKVR